jgi:uncharacterized protein YabN with tetrapyrrole methylase and pyrophosphatase domain
MEFELEQEVDGVVVKEIDNLTVSELSDLIIEWGKARGILINGNAISQFVKLTEEMGELASGLAKGNRELTLDSIGDMIVVLIMIADLVNTDIEHCLRLAWDEIKDRKGYLNADGIFVKEGDV